MWIGLSERSDVLQLFAEIDVDGNSSGSAYSRGSNGPIGRWKFVLCQDDADGSGGIGVHGHGHDHEEHFYLQNVFGEAETEAEAVAEAGRAGGGDERTGMWVGLTGSSLILHPRTSRGGLFGDRARWRLVPCADAGNGDDSNSTYLIQNVWGGPEEHR